MSKTKIRQGEINPRWSEAVIASSVDIDWSELPDLNNDTHNYFAIEWDKFSDLLWTNLYVIAEDALMREAYNHYMTALATNTWQATNDCWSDPPQECIITFTNIEDVYDRLVGKKRFHPVWIDQLSWTCEFLKIKML